MIVEMVVRQPQYDEPREGQASEQVRHEGDRPQADDLHPRALSGDHGVQRQEELFGEQLGMRQLQCEQPDAECHARQDVGAGGLFDEDHRQDAQTHVDPSEEAGDDEFRPLPVEPFGAFDDGRGRFID